MGWIDVIEAVPEVLPRRWKSGVGLVLGVAFMLFPSAARDLVSWYVKEKTQQILELLLPLLQQSSHA